MYVMSCHVMLCCLFFWQEFFVVMCDNVGELLIFRSAGFLGVSGLRELHLPFLLLKGIFLGWFVRGKKKKNNKDKNKKFLVSFFNVKDSEAGGCVRRQWVLLLLPWNGDGWIWVHQELEEEEEDEKRRGEMGFVFGGLMSVGGCG